MFEKVTGSVWLPPYDFDVWALPYVDAITTQRWPWYEI
jgi:hypothetical protein